MSFSALRMWPVLGLVLLAGRALALPSEAATEQVRVRLLSSAESVYPGAELLLGLEQKIIPHWHTYWKNPGDSGLPTTIAWSLPAGASAGPILWPVPSRVSLGPITNFAYSDSVTLLTAIQVPGDLQPGSAFTMAAKVKWLVCEETCIPQEAELGLSLPVLAGPSVSGSQGGWVEAARERLPRWGQRSASLEAGPGSLRLLVSAPELRSAQITRIEFFPAEWGRINHGAPQAWSQTAGGFALDLSPGEAPPGLGEEFSGVLAITESGPQGPVTRGLEIRAPVRAAGQGEAQGGSGFLGALGLAWLGGLILNLMPCVFPVLSLKALHLLAQTGESPGRVRRQGWAYAAGVLSSFAGLGLVLLVLRSGGAAVGWGFQFQSPVFVLMTAYLIFAVGLGLSGVVHLGASVTGWGSALAGRSGYTGSFFTGVLASVVAAPCTAPFMGAAMGYALTRPAPILLAVFLSLGLGLATPYVALSHWPRLQRLLPRPGRWMETLKQGLAFPMYATAIWLVWVLARQSGADGAALALAGMLAIGFAGWVRERTRSALAPTRLLGSALAASLLLLAVLSGYRGLETLGPEAAGPGADEAWEPYSPERFQALRSEGAPVFVNFTAAWCISCLVNERVALAVPAVAEAFRRQGVHYLKGDWTHRDPAISAKLAEFGRSGVPLYVYYPAGRNAVPAVLPQILTPEIVLSRLAGPSVSADSSLTFKE